MDSLLDGEFAAALVEDAGHGVVLAMGVLGWPLVPARVVELATKHREHGVVREPRDIFVAELLKRDALLGCGAIEEVGSRLFDEGKLQARGFAEVGGALVAGQTLNTVPLDPAILRKPL